jgi:hypothetical protein
MTMTTHGSAAPALQVKKIQRAEAIQVFTAQCATWAYLFADCETTLPDAVDHLQAAAVKLGLIDTIGQDEVQRLICQAFAPIREQDERQQVAREIVECGVAIAYDDEYQGLSNTFARACRIADAQYTRNKQAVAQHEHHVPSSTLMAAEYLVGLNDAKRLEAWFKERSERECAAIVAHIDKKTKP